MSDIVERLRFAADDTDAVENASVSCLLEHAADEIELLRGYRNEAESEASIASLVVQKLKEKPCPYVTGTGTQYCTLTPFTLTDAERDAVYTAALEADAHQHAERSAILRGLLERMG